MTFSGSELFLLGSVCGIVAAVTAFVFGASPPIVRTLWRVMRLLILLECTMEHELDLLAAREAARRSYGGLQ